MKMPPKPMLARGWDGRETKAMMVQPKLDGVRMLVCLPSAGRPSCWSRNGKSLQAMGEALWGAGCRELAAVGAAVGAGNVVLDGELYAHGAGFQTLVSMVKRGVTVTVTHTVADTDWVTHTLRYHVYDVFGVGGNDVGGRPFRERIEMVVRAAAATCATTCPLLVAVDTENVGSADEVEAALRRWTARGYEGVMVRDPDAPYEPGKRSASLLKYKRFQDAEFEIVGYAAARGKDAGTVVFVCDAGPHGRGTFNVRPMGTLAERRRMLRQAPGLVGERLTVRYQGLTDAGLPRFPVGVAVRSQYE